MDGAGTLYTQTLGPRDSMTHEYFGILELQTRVLFAQHLRSSEKSLVSTIPQAASPMAYDCVCLEQKRERGSSTRRRYDLENARPRLEGTRTDLPPSLGAGALDEHT